MWIKEIWNMKAVNYLMYQHKHESNGLILFIERATRYIFEMLDPS